MINNIWLLLLDSYREIILAIVISLRDAFFAVWGWGGVIYRWFLWVLDYPFAIGMWSIVTYTFIVRFVGTFLYHKAGIVNIRKALLFVPVSLLWWYVGSLFILKSSSIYLYILIWLFLFTSGVLRFFPIQTNVSKRLYIKNRKLRIIVWYILMIITDLVTAVVGWAWIIYTYIFKHFFWINALEATGMRIVFMIWRSITAVIVYYSAGTYSIKLILLLLLLGLPSFIIWTKFAIKKWDNFSENILWYLSLWLGIFMIYKWVMIFI